MPRQFHGRRPVVSPSYSSSAPAGGGSLSRPKRLKRKKPVINKGRGLNALQIAEKEVPDEWEGRIRKSRLGEIEEGDEEERAGKRRRIETEGAGEDVGGERGGRGGLEGDGERWHVMGEGDGEEGEEEDEDSDIESEDAFGESDEERFVGFAFRGSKEEEGKKRGGRRGEEDEEDEEEDGDSLGEDAVDLATAWDMDDVDEAEAAEEKKNKKRAREDSEDEEMDSDNAMSDDEDDSGADEEDMQSDLSVSDAEDGDHSRLQNFVQSLSKKSDASKPTSAPRSTKISAADLLQYVKDPAQRQSIKILQNSEKKAPEQYKGGIPGKLAAPLPKRQQDRLDRSAAYGESKKELGKWVDTVKQNRRAEHLSFPLVDPNDPVATASRRLASTQEKPMNELERKVQEIVQEAGMVGEGVKGGDEADREEEELEELKLPFEKIQARRAELRKQRDLMFREEIRARRVKKIKSKAYRRIHRKERAKQGLEQQAEDAANGLVDSEEEHDRNDRLRAEERMGRRHRESKWAKAMKETGRAKWDGSARGAMEEAARRDEELRRRIEGRDVDEDSLSGNDEDSDGYSSDEEGVALNEKLAQLSKEGADGPSSKLGNMAFMRRAEAAKKARNDAEIHDLRRQLNGEDDFEMDSDLEEGEPIGRQKFGAKTPQPTKESQRKPLGKGEFEEQMSEDDFSGLEDAGGALAAAPSGPMAKAQPSARAPFPKAAASQPRINGAKKQAGPDDRTKKQLVKPIKKPETALDEYTSPSESENDDPNAALDGFGPDSLAVDIFAGDDSIVKDFVKEKQEIVEEEGDQIIDNGLPGWGSWTGAGVSKKQQNRQKNKFLTTIKGVAPEKRQDSKLDRVIINEKRVKKNGKYLATELPHPFESKQQYERSLRLPLGPEWTTKSTFQDATKPRVLFKQGVIRPMTKPQV